MAKPKDRYVVRNPDGGWDVKAAHAKRSSKHTQTQAEAIQHAKDIVSNAGGGEVRIQDHWDATAASATATPSPPATTRTHPRTPSTDVIHASMHSDTGGFPVLRCSWPMSVGWCP